MNHLLYYLVVKPISLLPFWILYRISDLLKILIWNVFGYRKKVVLTNIRNSFPEKSEKEVVQIAKGFYTHFCDLVLESVKGFSIRKRHLDKRMVSEDLSLWYDMYQKGKHVIFVGGHYGNWEMCAVALGGDLPHHLIGIYKRLNNPFWDKKMRDSRSVFGTEMIPTFTVDDRMQNMKVQSTVAFIFDQSPRDPRKGYWTTFLNQETAILQGAEKYARQYNLPVIYGKLKKEKRGMYRVTYELLCEDPTTMKEGEILQRMNHILEQQIKETPEHWLWSHKRWKHQRPEDMPLHPRMHFDKVEEEQT